MLEEIKREIIRTGIKLDRYGLIAHSACLIQMSKA